MDMMEPGGRYDGTRRCCTCSGGETKDWGGDGGEFNGGGVSLCGGEERDFIDLHSGGETNNRVKKKKKKKRAVE